MSTAPRNKDRDPGRDRELSEILLEAQLVRAEALQAAQREAKLLGEPLWRLLLREGMLSDDQLFRALKQYVRVPVLAEEHLENVMVPPELREACKPSLAQLLGVLPLERSTDGRRAALAMIDPTLDISPLWPALTGLGVVEVRRFLLNLPTLRRGMQMFYGQSLEAAAADAALDGPTPPPSRSAITQPIPRPTSDGPSVLVDPQLQAEIAQLSGAVPALPLSSDPTGPIETAAIKVTTPSRPPLPGAPHRASPAPGSAIPLPVDLPELTPPPLDVSSQATPVREPAGVRSPAAGAHSGPALPAPEGLAHAPGPSRSAPVPPSTPAAASTRSVPGPASPAGVPGPTPAAASTRSVPGPTPAAESTRSIPGPIPAAASTRSVPGPTPAPSPGPAPTPASPPRSAQSPVQELSTADMVVDVDMDEERSELSRDRSALRVPAASSEPEPEVAPDAVQDALLSTCEALVTTIESQLRTTWPTTLSRLCQGVGDRLGFAPRAVRELMLVARLRGVVRAELLTRGPLPPVVPTLLGYPTSLPLLAAARELQKVLVDFMRLPQDEDEPLGTRIVTTAALALELSASGLDEDALGAKLRELAGDTDVAFHVHKALLVDPPQLETLAAEPALPAAGPASPPAPHRPPAAGSPALWPLPPRMPTVAWSTTQVAQLAADGLLPYQADEG